MRTLLICMLCAVTAYAQYDSAPVPPRLLIPGAVPVGGFRPTDYRQGRLQQAVPVRLQQPPHHPTPARIRRPGQARPSFKSVEPPQRPNLQSIEDAPAKPVTEEPEDDLIEINTPTTLGFAPSFFSTTQQQNDFYDITTTSQPKPPSAYNSPTPQPFQQPTIQPFRPEIIPTNNRPNQFYRPQQFAPIIRNEQPQQPPQQPIKAPVRLTPLSQRPQRPSYRPDPKPYLDEEEPAQIQQQPQRHHPRPIEPVRPVKSQPQKYTPLNPKEKKPVAQILRKYRDENPDGSITWGFENDDGSFKEETIGIDCVTRGKYGYVDPDGLKREYNYETGILCDKSKEDQEEKGFIDYQENRAVLPNGVTIDLAAMGKKSKRPLRSSHKV